MKQKIPFNAKLPPCPTQTLATNRIVKMLSLLKVRGREVTLRMQLLRYTAGNP